MRRDEKQNEMRSLELNLTCVLLSKTSGPFFPGFLGLFFNTAVKFGKLTITSISRMFQVRDADISFHC